RQKVDAMSRIETARSLFLCLKLHSKKQTQRKMAWRSENV
ncbi:hypothetical protein CGSSa03_14777, partial [Staphylococcus aureus subsp. aureus CGS03]